MHGLEVFYKHVAAFEQDAAHFQMGNDKDSPFPINVKGRKNNAGPTWTGPDKVVLLPFLTFYFQKSLNGSYHLNNWTNYNLKNSLSEQLGASHFLLSYMWICVSVKIHFSNGVDSNDSVKLSRESWEQNKGNCLFPFFSSNSQILFLLLTTETLI